MCSHLFDMGRQRPRIGITLDPDLYDWINSKIEDHTFRNFSHGVEYCIAKVKEGEEKK